MITKLDAFIAQIINDAMRPDYFSVQLLFKHAGLGLRLDAVIREQDGGISPEVGELIRRALVGEDIETATLSVGEPNGGASLQSGHVRDQLQVKDAEGQVQRVGYGSPPMHSRFQKGCSGNLAGRPRISRTLPRSHSVCCWSG
jgi:hypothetical protein